MHQGQIVEIPENASIYERLDQIKFDSKADELEELAKKIQYTLYDGILLDGHFGIEQFELCQRKGVTKGGHPKPLYVISIDQEAKRVFVGAGKNHPGLFTKVVLLDNNNISWNINNSKIEYPFTCEIQLATEGKNEKLKAILYQFDEKLYLEFQHKVKCFYRNKDLNIFQNENLVATYQIHN